MRNYCILTLSKYDDQLERMLSTLLVAQPNLSLSDIYVVDDGLPEAIKERWKVNYIPGEQPFAFSRNFNRGISATPKDKDVFFMGDDVIVMTKLGIDVLAQTAYSDEMLAMTGPSVFGGVGNGYQRIGALAKLTYRKELEGQPGYTPTLVFIAAYIKREIIEKVGPIPETLVGYGFEDSYFSRKMIGNGYDWAINPQVIVYHGWGENESASSYVRSGLNLEGLSETNSKIFKDLMDQK